jgi:monofunctional biosynthetic peptidoglycan transglycosylase
LVKKTAWLLILIPLIYFGSFFFHPPVAPLKTENPRRTSFMETREQEWRREGKKLRVRQQWVPLARISPFLIKAVTIAEDDKFFKHEGFDFEAIQQAVEKNIKAGKFKAGGSTISQQLAKNLFLDPSKNPIRKIKEAILTWRLERVLSKKRIMELYLNVVEWGEGVFGAEMAARSWYGKPAAALGPEEAARLAAILPNPRKHNPLGSSRYVANRSRIIYNIMVRRGIVIPAYEEVMDPGPRAGQPGAEEAGRISPPSGPAAFEGHTPETPVREAAPPVPPPPPLSEAH